MRFVALLLAAALALAPVQAFAQATQSFNTTALPTTFTASTTTGASPVPFPSPGPTAVIINNSTTVPVYLNMGSNTVSATTSDFLLGPGCIAAYNIAGKPYIAAITATGTALLQIQTGTGLPTLPSNACYIPVSFTGSYTTNLTQVNTNPVNTGVGVSGSGTQRVAVSSDSSLGITGALPTGTNILGKVGIDQTTPGTTNGVQVNAALPAGSAVIGKVSIDQTTPGTTNAVVVNSPLAVAPIVSTSGSVTSLVLKASATTTGALYYHAENATATSGYCILYNATTAPSAGVLTAASVLGFQLLPANGYCDWGARGVPPIAASAGVVLLLSSAATPFTYTTGVIAGSVYGLAQ